jgi:hypothetical protein
MYNCEIPKTNLVLNAENLERNLITNFVEALDLSSKSSSEDFENCTEEFIRCTKSAARGEWSSLFRGGYTPMLLDADMMSLVVAHFQKKRDNEEQTSSLNIKIYDAEADTIVCTVIEEDIQY